MYLLVFIIYLYYIISRRKTHGLRLYFFVHSVIFANFYSTRENVR